VRRLRRWWRRRRGQRRDECEVCAAQPRQIWKVGSSFTDDASLGIGGGGSFMTATYCKAHKPATAQRRPNQRR
jgi:hypothetical protein